VFKEHKVSRVIKDSKAHKELAVPVHKDSKDSKDSKELKVYKELKVL